MSPLSLLVKSVLGLDGSACQVMIELDRQCSFERAQDCSGEARVERGITCNCIPKINFHEDVVSQRQVEKQPCSAWTQARPCAPTLASRDILALHNPAPPPRV